MPTRDFERLKMILTIAEEQFDGKLAVYAEHDELYFYFGDVENNQPDAETVAKLDEEFCKNDDGWMMFT